MPARIHLYLLRTNTAATGGNTDDSADGNTAAFAKSSAATLFESTTLLNMRL